MSDRRTETDDDDASEDYMAGFAAALASVARRPGATAAVIKEVLVEHEMTLEDLAESGADEEDIEELRKLAG